MARRSRPAPCGNTSARITGDPIVPRRPPAHAGSTSATHPPPEPMPTPTPRPALDRQTRMATGACVQPHSELAEAIPALASCARICPRQILDPRRTGRPWRDASNSGSPEARTTLSTLPQYGKGFPTGDRRPSPETTPADNPPPTTTSGLLVPGYSRINQRVSLRRINRDPRFTKASPRPDQLDGVEEAPRSFRNSTASLHGSST